MDQAPLFVIVDMLKKPHRLRVVHSMVRRSGRHRGYVGVGRQPNGYRPTGASESKPGVPQNENYSLLVISLYSGTEFQPNSTLSTDSLHAPLTVEYHSGIA